MPAAVVDLVAIIPFALSSPGSGRLCEVAQLCGDSSQRTKAPGLGPAWPCEPAVPLCRGSRTHLCSGGTRCPWRHPRGPAASNALLPAELEQVCWRPCDLSLFLFLHLENFESCKTLQTLFLVVKGTKNAIANKSYCGDCSLVFLR